MLLKEYVNVEKMHNALETLKKLGHPEYQFYEPSDFQNYARRCEEDDPNGYKTLFEDDEFDESDEEIEASSSENVMNIEDTNSKEPNDENDVSNRTSEDEIEEFEKREEHYLKVDAVAKEQFEYNRNIAFANDFPELEVNIQNDAIDLAPGEGKEI